MVPVALCSFVTLLFNNRQRHLAARGPKRGYSLCLTALRDENCFTPHLMVPGFIHFSASTPSARIKDGGALRNSIWQGVGRKQKPNGVIDSVGFK